METLSKRPTTTDGMVGQMENLKLTQLLHNQTTVISKKKGAVDFYDEYFFGYSDRAANHKEPKFEADDLEVRYGIL